MYVPSVLALGTTIINGLTIFSCFTIFGKSTNKNSLTVWIADLNFSGLSFLYKAFHKTHQTWSRYIEFADWWGFDNFRSEDYLKEEYKEKKIMSIAEQAYITYAKKLLEGELIDPRSQERKIDKSKIQEFLPKLETFIEIREKKFVSDLVKEGITIISGLALGCDSIAHKEALNGGKTVAILPNTLNKIMPSQNENLANQIVENGGLLITEYYEEFNSSRELIGRYQERDRLQALFCDTIILTASYSKTQQTYGIFLIKS